MNNKEPAIVYWLDDTLYLNITNQCSNNCWFCFRNFKSGVGGFNLKLKEEPTAAKLVCKLDATLHSKPWSEVVFCGFGEPTARLDLLLETTKWIKTRIPMVPIRLDTNGHGYALNPGREVALELKAAGVSKASVSLNGDNEETYRENCRPAIINGFEVVLEFVRKARAAGLEVEVSAVRMPEVDLRKVGEIADAMGVQFRVRDYVPCFW
jgi:TatD family-associated radical SAM protein